MVENQLAKAVSDEVALRAVDVRRGAKLADMRVAVAGLAIATGGPRKRCAMRIGRSWLRVAIGTSSPRVGALKLVPGPRRMIKIRGANL